MLLITWSPWKKLGQPLSMSLREAFNGQSKGWNGGVPLTLIVQIFFSFDDGVIFLKLLRLVNYDEFDLKVVWEISKCHYNKNQKVYFWIRNKFDIKLINLMACR
jgi:hypothetical protein